MPAFYKEQVDNYTLELLLVIVDRVAIKYFKSKICKYFGTVKVIFQIFRTQYFLLLLVGMFNMLVAEVCFLGKKKIYIYALFFEGT